MSHVVMCKISAIEVYSVIELTLTALAISYKYFLMRADSTEFSTAAKNFIY